MAARVVVISLASDFGCQVQMTNLDDQLLAVLGQFELSYWQLASSGHLPERVRRRRDRGRRDDARSTSRCSSAFGRTASDRHPDRRVRGDRRHSGSGRRGLRGASGLRVRRRRRAARAASGSHRCPSTPSSSVDYRVPGCPIQPAEFVAVLQRALMGLSDHLPREPMCASCKVAENVCFYERGQVCLGLVTRSGCGAKCVSLGRPCTGCRGIADDANLEYARDSARRPRDGPGSGFRPRCSSTTPSQEAAR